MANKSNRANPPKTKKAKTSIARKGKLLDSPQSIDLPCFKVKISVKSNGVPAKGCETRWSDVTGASTDFFDMGDAGEYTFMFNATNVLSYLEIRGAKGSAYLFDWIITCKDGIQQDVEYDLNLLKCAAR